MGITASKTNSDSINWDNINTESMSSTVPTLKKISKDAELLVSNLNLEDNVKFTETDSDHDNLFTWIKNIDNNKTNNNSENSFSDTSPFISPDMYKYLMNNSEKNTTSSFNQQGGGVKGDDSSTSSTSSSPRKNKKTKRSNKKKFTESSTEMSGGDLSYISSSAHTNSNNSEIETSVSVGNNNILTSSVNTDDIRLVSSDSN